MTADVVRPSRLRTVAAIARRDWRMQRSYQFQLVMRLAQTGFVVASLSITAKLVRSPPELAQYGGDYFTFALIGISMLAFLTAGLRTFGARLGEEQSLGTLEVVLASPVDLATFLLGSLVVPFAMAMLSVVGFMVVGVAFFGARFPITGVLLAIPIAGLTLAVFSAIGILSASFIVLTKRGDPIAVLAAQLSTFLGGAFFPISLLPRGIRWSAHLFPSYYSLQGLRAVLIGGGAGDALAPTLVLAGFTAVLLPGSLWCFRWSIRTCMRLGTLGTY
ncbi:ABC transporter permease [Aquihabitans sp. G128]|uniref:ABC transporter permease n=1 Tax=Aquihabitans sp. G128 TaxID=2849779 RepID=UPI001C248712|nr:ABC transporter permease [Aquihabitans sp. G128]QXC61733.1 ABC transporter permease [Aquihabitans sp. G128]